MEAYFIISEDSIDEVIIGVSNKYKGRYNSFIIFVDFSLSVPIIIRSGRIKSFIADPSLRNSGLDTTSKFSLGTIFEIIFLIS